MARPMRREQQQELLERLASAKNLTDTERQMVSEWQQDLADGSLSREQLEALVELSEFRL